MVASTADSFSVGPPAEHQPARSGSFGIGRFLVIESPYILMLMMALGGIAYRGFIGHPILGYWVFLMPVFALLCIVGGLRHTQSSKEVIDLLWMQVLQWSAFLLAMYVLTLRPVKGALDDNAMALLQLMMLALGTFVAGVSTRSWRVGLVGFILLVAVPVVSWIDMSATLIIISLVTLLVALGLFWMVERRIARRLAG
jgi:hypothetical protein